MTKVLIADGSRSGREFVERILTADADIQVIGAVGGGGEALEFLRRKRPDVVIMDSEMPGMERFEGTRRIMETIPLPVVVVSGVTKEERRSPFDAFEAGALAVVSRPPDRGEPEFEEAANELRQTIKTMAEVRVVRRWSRERDSGSKRSINQPSPSLVGRGSKIVGIGASTGGPAVLKKILGELPREFPFPILLVQHMSHGFLEGFAEWLRVVTNLPVSVAEDGERVRPGCVYVGPERRQIAVRGDGRIVLSKEGKNETAMLSPSISWLFRSLADSYGPASVGVLLSGMGRDGADGMKRIRERGGITIAQSGETCIVNGMPEEAIRLDAVNYILSPERIGEMLGRFARQRG